MAKKVTIPAEDYIAMDLHGGLSEYLLENGVDPTQLTQNTYNEESDSYTISNVKKPLVTTFKIPVWDFVEDMKDHPHANVSMDEGRAVSEYLQKKNFDTSNGYYCYHTLDGCIRFVSIPEGDPDSGKRIIQQTI